MFGGYKMRYPTPRALEEKIIANQSRFKNLTSLEEKCLRSIGRSYLELGTRELELSIQQISPRLKEKMLQLIMRDRASFPQNDASLLRLLITRYTTYFHFDVMSDTRIDSSEEKYIWKKLGEVAVGLKQVIHAFSYIYDQPIVLDSILKMSKLQHLDVAELVCTGMDLTLIAYNLKDLRYINVGLHFESPGPFYEASKALEALEHLQVFMFRVKNYPTRMLDKDAVLNVLIALFITRLTKVKVLGSTPELVNMRNVCLFHDFFSCFPMIHEKFKLEHFMLKLDSLKNDYSTVVPNLRSLGIYGSDCQIPLEFLDLSSLTNFPLLTMLQLCSVYFPTTATRILHHVGHKLTKFWLSCSGECDFGAILSACPKLIHLKINARGGFAPAGRAQGSMENVQTLSLDTRLFRAADGASAEPECLPDGVLLQIAKAPALRELSLVNVDISDEEVGVLLPLLEKGEIFQNLEKMEYHVMFHSYRPSVYFLFDHIAAYCPKLRELIIDYQNILAPHVDDDEDWC